MASLALVLPVSLIHQCSQSHERHIAGNQPESTLNTAHLRCDICDFSFPPYVNVDFGVLELQSFLYADFQSIIKTTPTHSFTQYYLLRGPPERS